jgi:hypothetical protein
MLPSRRHLMLAVLLVAACAPPPFQNVTPELRRRAANTPLLTSEQMAGRSHVILGEVVGRSCAREDGSDPSIDTARDELKLRAAEQNADAVSSVLCKEGRVDLLHCLRSVECRGDAIRWTSTM